MTTRARKRRLPNGTMVLLPVLGIGLLAPFAIGLLSPDLHIDSASVVAAPIDSHAISAPVMLSQSPAISVERGTVILMSSNGYPASGAAALALLKSGGGDLVLDGATLSISGTDASKPSPPAASDAAGQEPKAPLQVVLETLAFETLTVRHSNLVLRLPTGHAESLSDVDGTISLKRKGIVAAKGSGLMRGERVAFEVAVATAPARRGAEKGGERLPLKLDLTSPTIRVAFDGTWASGDATQLQGPVEVHADNLRQLARWLGAGWPLGPGLRNLELKGQLDWNAQAMSFETASIALDGNIATGALAVNPNGAVPALTGTLAFRSLDVSRYLDAVSDDDQHNPWTWASLAASQIGIPLGKMIDADMRLSADRVIAGKVEIGRSAAAIALRAGRLSADVAELNYGAGTGSGQISADFTGLWPHIVIRGKLDDVDLARAVVPIGGQGMMDGTGTITADLSASGLFGLDVVRNLNGKVAIRSTNPGHVGLDLVALMTAARTQPLEGWTPAGKGTTTFDQLELKLLVRGGVIQAESAQLSSGDGIWQAFGEVDLPAAKVDLQIQGQPSLARIALDEGAAVRSAGTIEVRGSLAAPIIQRIATSASAHVPPGATARSPIVPQPPAERGATGEPIEPQLLTPAGAGQR